MKTVQLFTLLSAATCIAAFSVPREASAHQAGEEGPGDVPVNCPYEMSPERCKATGFQMCRCAELTHTSLLPTDFMDSEIIR